jgi:hypothetical protein
MTDQLIEANGHSGGSPHITSKEDFKIILTPFKNTKLLRHASYQQALNLF